MPTSQVIQTGISLPIDTAGNNVGTSKICIDSNGRLYVFYRYVNISEKFAIAYSDDNGFTWTEVETSMTESGVVPWAMAIDSQDKLHMAYARQGGYWLHYRTYQNGTFGSEETIYDGTVGTDDIKTGNIDIAIDSNDVPHVTWQQFESGGTAQVIYYTNRSSGSWAARTQISVNDGNRREDPRILIDSNNYRYIFWKGITGGGNDTAVFYSKYETTWTGPIQQFTCNNETAGIAAAFSVVLDSNDDVHLVFANIQGDDYYQYAIYDSSLDIWSSTTNISAAFAVGDFPSIGIDQSDNLYVMWTNGETYFTKYTGTWSSPAVITSDTGRYGVFNTPLYPILEGVSSQRLTTGYHFAYRGTVGAASAIKYFASNDFDFVTPLDKNYSSKAAAALPSNDANLTNLFTESEYVDVATTDDVFSTQSATDEYSIFLFKNKGNSSSDNIVVTWIGQSSIAPSTSTIYLQIYNRNSATWETLASNSTTSANTTFSLSGTKTSSLSNYYDGSNWVSCRVYQLAA